MTGRYSDDEALRPVGEANHVPDDQLASSGEPRRQRSESIDSDYPDNPTAAGTECASCRASIPAGQSKCPFCLTNYLGGNATSTNESASTTVLGIVHLVVESTTFYGAVAKGGAAATLLAANDAEPAVNDYSLIYDLDEPPARQLADQWPSLPEAVQVSSDEGERLLSVARDRDGWHGQEASERQEQAPTRLYDQRGDGIRDASRLDGVLDDADDAVWLVPAMALTESRGEAAADRQVSSVPTTQELECQTCERATDHRFKSHESVPDEAWTGQPIWECQVCGSARYGPSLE
ncbi:hypothetical protein [Halorubrum sp. Atlit-26R]|uniref:biosurfactant protein 1 n=1 Tax=Halorubrum sp. Atlit-26R TaxID=2282128 RepID=UPI000EF1822C|nr:hypothetical protein [Halorubrum sp. Atlit-26R]RLM62609.1 hypothetical protein DVK07_18365 [Halorubrum sp. Atlit-26R]